MASSIAQASRDLKSDSRLAGQPHAKVAPRNSAVDQFIEVSKPAGIHFSLTSGGPDKRSSIETNGGGVVAWLDYNNDGFPDLFFVNGSSFENMRRGDSPPSALYKNN